APLFEIGAAVRVPKYAQGVVQSIAGEQVTIVFPDKTERTFMANFVSPA
ncbi:MAG: recombinase RecQ, partial [Massilia sp.]|nr:recombinase RecQ [Massilia sp.]